MVAPAVPLRPDDRSIPFSLGCGLVPPFRTGKSYRTDEKLAPQGSRGTSKAGPQQRRACSATPTLGKVPLPCEPSAPFLAPAYSSPPSAEVRKRPGTNHWVTVCLSLRMAY
jgi:hypothetical protein